MKSYSKLITSIIIVLLLNSLVSSRSFQESKIINTKNTTIDNTTYIDANKILMFVTNHGNFGRDLGGVFGYSYGTFFPYTGNPSDVANNVAGAADKSPIYAAGLWIGGKVNGEIRTAISEYDSEYVPGPMSNGTFLPDSPIFKVFKLYYDSLQSNPNYDYTFWPSYIGAPADELGRPLMRGDQMLWSVYNDANPIKHQNDAGLTLPLGIEIQQTVWAQDEDGTDTIPATTMLEVNVLGSAKEFLKVHIVDANQLTGDDYIVVTNVDSSLVGSWSLINRTTNTVLLSDQSFFNLYPNTPIIDGFQLEITNLYTGFKSFQVVANANGPLVPVESGALDFQNFPVPDGTGLTNGRPSENQQVAAGMWAMHTGDNGGSSGGGTRGSFEVFLTRSMRNENLANMGIYDYEMRFTGSYDNPGVNGSYAVGAFDILPEPIYWVPFELWRTGIGTPNDLSDDIRLIPWMIDIDEDNSYNLASWGSSSGANGGDFEHSASGGDNDPYTDWVYWRLPENSSAGDAGYQDYIGSIDLVKMTNKIDFDSSYQFDGKEIFARMVLINWNGGEQPPFNQDLPELGTIFRMTTKKSVPIDTNSFTATPPQILTTGGDGVSLYMMYKLFNKGGNQIDSCYVSIWSDPDLGNAADDLVGCDTISDIFFCYNESNVDNQYGNRPPAVGFKVIHGPLVPSQGDNAFFDETIIPNYKNLNMSSFNKYFNGTDPRSAQEAFYYMQGTDAKNGGAPYVYNGDTLNYMHSGDPVLGIGDLDFASNDRRMMASFGPFDFAPGDSQYVLIKMAVGQGSSNLESITKLKEVLNEPYRIRTDIDDDKPIVLPKSFTLVQNYPNPFNPTTQIKFAIPTRSDVTIEIFNVLGQKVATLIDKELPAGNHVVEWDATEVSTGMYFYKLTAGDFVQSKKMMLLK